MREIEAIADVLRSAAKGDLRSQMRITLEILAVAERADPFARMFIEMQALCYARLAAAHGDAGALHLAAMIGSAIANAKDGASLGVAVSELRADALAMLDVAADIASPADRPKLEAHLHELSALAGAQSAVLAQPHRLFWGHVVSEELDAQ